MSSVFIDLAIDAGVPIVPVRFVGGLPIETAGRFEFPVGFGKQDYWFGRPIFPAELRETSYADRARRILSAINALGVAPKSEYPSTPNSELERKIASRPSGQSEADAVLSLILSEDS